MIFTFIASAPCLFFHPVHDLGLNQSLEFVKLLQDGRLLVLLDDLRRVFCEGSSEGISIPGFEEDQIFGLLSGGVFLEGIVYTVLSSDLLKGFDVFIRDLCCLSSKIDPL